MLCSPSGGQDRLLRVGEGGHDVVELVLERGEGGVEAAHRGLEDDVWREEDGAEDGVREGGQLAQDRGRQQARRQAVRRHQLHLGKGGQE